MASKNGFGNSRVSTIKKVSYGSKIHFKNPVMISSPIQKATKVSQFNKFKDMGYSSSSKGGKSTIDPSEYFKVGKSNKLANTKTNTNPRTTSVISAEQAAKNAVKIEGDGVGMNAKKETNQFGVETIGYGL